MKKLLFITLLTVHAFAVDEIEALRAANQDALLKASAPLRKKMVADLEALQKKFVAQNRLEDAVAAKAESARIQFCGRYEIERGNSHKWIIFFENGTALNNEGTAGNWSLRDGVVEISFVNFWKYTFRVGKTPQDKMEAVAVWKGGGLTWNPVLKRVD